VLALVRSFVLLSFPRALRAASERDEKRMVYGMETPMGREEEEENLPLFEDEIDEGGETKLDVRYGAKSH